MNRINLIGKISNEPKVLNFGSGKALSFQLETKEEWKDKATGASKNAYEWHNILISGTAMAEEYMHLLHKGVELFVEGKMEFKTYTPPNGGETKKMPQVNVNMFKGNIIILNQGTSPAVATSSPKKSNKYDDLDDFSNADLTKRLNVKSSVFLEDSPF